MNASPDSNDAPRRCADRSGVRHPPVEEWSQLTGQLTRSWRRAFSRRSNLLRRLLIAGWLAIAWPSAQADETTRIALEKTAWKQLSGPPLEWPQAGRPLVLAAGQELLSVRPLRVGECCIIRARLQASSPPRPHAWETAADDSRWGLRNQAATEILAMRVVGQQGFLDCQDGGHPGPLPPRPIGQSTPAERPAATHTSGRPRVHFIDQHSEFTYRRALDYRFAITSQDVLAHVTARPTPPGGWLAERLVNPRGPMSVWLHSGAGSLVIESITIVETASLALDQTIINARKFQARYVDIEQLLRQLRAEFDLDAHDAYRTGVESQPQGITVKRQVSELYFDRNTCRITSATIDGVSPRGCNLPNLVVVDDGGDRFEQAASHDGRLWVTSDKFHVFLEGEFTPRSKRSGAFQTSFLVRYTIYKMNGLITVEIRPRQPARLRRLSLEHELGQTARGLRFFYLEGEPGPNPASLTWQNGWDVGNLDLSADGPLSLYRRGDQPINNGHFVTIHDGQLGFQLLPLTWNHSRLDPDPLWALSTGGWSLPGESLRSTNWQSTAETTGIEKCLVLTSTRPQAIAQRNVILPDQDALKNGVRTSQYDVWVRLRGTIDVALNRRRIELMQADGWGWQRWGTCPTGPVQIEVRSRGAGDALDDLYFLPTGSAPPGGATVRLLRDRNFHKMTLSSRAGAPVVHVTFVNQPTEITLDPLQTYTYALGCLPPKRWQPQHHNTTSLETMFQAHRVSDTSKNWERSWRQDLPEMPRAVNALTRQSGMTMAAVNQGGYFGVGWPITERRKLDELTAEVRANRSRMLAYNDVAVGQSGTLVERGYYLTQELRDEAPTAIPNWMSLESRTWRAHNLLRTRDIMASGFDAIYFDSTQLHATLFNRFGWNNALGLQRFYEDTQLLLRHLGKAGGLAVHCWGQIPLVNVGLADMTLPGEQYWVGKNRSGLLEPAALQSSFNSYLAGCQVVGLLGSDTVPFDDPQFYHQMLGNGWYSWFQFYPYGVSTKSLRIPSFTVQELELFRKFHDPLVLFGTAGGSAIDSRQPAFTQWVSGLPNDVQAVLYHRPDRTLLVLARRDAAGSTGPKIKLRLDTQRLALGSRLLMLDAVTRKVTAHESDRRWLEIPDIDLTLPRQLVFLRRPDQPRVIWHDLQTRRLLDQLYNTFNRTLNVVCEGVPGARSQLVVWIENAPVYFTLLHPKRTSRTKVKLRLPRAR